jgi:DNA primase
MIRRSTRRAIARAIEDYKGITWLCQCGCLNQLDAPTCELCAARRPEDQRDS